MAGFFYYGEDSGARILRANTGVTQVTSASTEQVHMHVKTWDWLPAGPIGDNVFREVAAVLKVSNGISFSLTPVVDEEDQLLRSFSVAGARTVEASAPVLERGARAAAELITTSRTGDVELEDILISGKGLRTTP